MAETFAQGYALLIGVGQSAYAPKADVSTTQGALSVLPVGLAYLLFAPLNRHWESRAPAGGFTQQDPDASRLAAIAKTYASDVAMDVTSSGVQVHGGAGYVADFPVEMLMRDAKINQIYEGTNQILRMVIARTYFGELAR